MVTILSLPFELHLAISCYLTPDDRQALSHTCSSLLDAYRPAVYSNCSNVGCKSARIPIRKQVPYPIILNPGKASWFFSEHVQSLKISMPEVSKEYDFFNGFVLSVEDYPNLQTLYFDPSIILLENLINSNFVKGLLSFKEKNQNVILV